MSNSLRFRSQMDITPTTPEPPAIKVERNVLAFVKVSFISPGSPAEESGIRKDDEIVEFGSINAGNFIDLKQIGELVMHRQNQQIGLKVKRFDQLLELTLIPKVWSGRGLLGCNIVLTTINV